MTKEQFEQWLVSLGYNKNRWGYYTRLSSPIFRWKLSDRSVKLERSYRNSNGRLCWFRYYGGYYCNLSMTPENKLRGFSRSALGSPPKGAGNE